MDIKETSFGLSNNPGGGGMIIRVVQWAEEESTVSSSQKSCPNLFNGSLSLTGNKVPGALDACDK